MILGMPCDLLILGESTTTPPQGVNGINHPNPTLFHARYSIVTLVQYIQVKISLIMRFQLETIRSSMINFASMMASRDKPLRRLSPMWRDIFRRERLYNIFFLLIPRSLGFQLTTIWSNVTNNPTMMTNRNKLNLSLFP
jgi:hypothetical protein